MLCFIILNIRCQFYDTIITRSIYLNEQSIDTNYIAGLDKFKNHNMLMIRDELIKALLYITEVLGIIKK